MGNERLEIVSEQDWLRALWVYLLFIAGANLVWEFSHMPLYTVWATGTSQQIIIYGLHCTVGDVLIAETALLLSLFLAGNSKWPCERFQQVAMATVLLGLSYTLYSEWLNVYVKQSWAYSDLMPIIPGTGIGASPIAQWIVILPAGFYLIKRSL